MDVSSLITTGNKRQDVNLSLLRHAGGAWWVVIGLMMAQEGSILLTQHAVKPLAKLVLESSTAKSSADHLKTGFKNCTWLIGPAMFAAAQLLRNRSRGLSNTENTFLKEAKREMTLKDRMLNSTDIDNGDLAYKHATEALSRLHTRMQKSAADRVGKAKKDPSRVTLHSTTRIALRDAFANNESIGKLLIRKSQFAPGDAKIPIRASELLTIAMLVKDELDIKIPDNLTDGLSAAALKKLLGTSDVDALKGWEIQDDIQTDKDLNTVLRKAESFVTKAEKQHSTKDASSLVDDISSCKTSLDILLQFDDTRAIDLGFEMLELQDQLDAKREQHDDKLLRDDSDDDKQQFFDNRTKPEEYLTHLEFLHSIASLETAAPKDRKAAKKEIKTLTEKHAKPGERDKRRSSFMVNLENVLTFSEDRDVIASALRDPEIIKQLANNKITDTDDFEKALGLADRTKGWAKRRNSSEPIKATKLKSPKR